MDWQTPALYILFPVWVGVLGYYIKMEAIARLIICLVLFAVLTVGYIAVMRAGKGGE